MFPRSRVSAINGYSFWDWTFRCVNRSYSYIVLYVNALELCRKFKRCIYRVDTSVYTYSLVVLITYTHSTQPSTHIDHISVRRVSIVVYTINMYVITRVVLVS